MKLLTLSLGLNHGTAIICLVGAVGIFSLTLSQTLLTKSMSERANEWLNEWIMDYAEYSGSKCLDQFRRSFSALLVVFSCWRGSLEVKICGIKLTNLKDLLSMHSMLILYRCSKYVGVLYAGNDIEMSSALSFDKNCFSWKLTLNLVSRLQMESDISLTGLLCA